MIAQNYIKDDDLIDFVMYANLDGTELGEVCLQLSSLYHRRDLLSDSMTELLVKEIHDQLTTFQECTTIHEETVTETITKTYKTLEWI